MFSPMLTVASPLTACYFLSISHGSTPRHLVPVAEAPELPGNKIFWTSTGKERVFALLPHTEIASKLLTEKTRLWEPFGKCSTSCRATNLWVVNRKDQDREYMCNFHCHLLSPAHSWSHENQVSPDTTHLLHSPYGPCHKAVCLPIPHQVYKTGQNQHC